ncbi:hypothetical protein D3C83_134700 [compost metagenome]
MIHRQRKQILGPDHNVSQLALCQRTYAAFVKRSIGSAGGICLQYFVQRQALTRNKSTFR